MADIPTEEKRTQIVEFLTSLRESVDPPASNMMILATSNAVSCAQTECTRQGDASESYLTLCLFKLNGGNADERPYEQGKSCSECPDGFACRRKQCSDDPSPVTHSPSPTTFISTIWSQATNTHLPMTDISTKSSVPAAVSSTNSPAPSTSIATGVFPVMIVAMIASGLCLIV
uniref:SCP domain-containing protein n=1 Tax=Mesocestoides corti TaxID=53468 RepID=A0A5K3G260_MESCO